jgi:microcystin-dependent protein
MSEPFIAEIRMVGFDFAPRGWAICDGAVMPINQNTALFSLLGTTYGGDGRVNFALPDMRGRTPIHEGTNPGGTTYRLGANGGSETHTLRTAEIPSHTHRARASSQIPNAESATNHFPAQISSNPYSASNANASLLTMVQNAGDNLGHNNMQPYLAVNFCICLQGIFPSRS